MGNYTAIQVGNALLDEARRSENSLSPMKLQKLAYYAHGWHLALVSEPLIDEGVEAWRYGPVVKSLYHEFKKFGKGAIDRLGATVEFTDDGYVSREPMIPSGSDAHDLTSQIWRIYGKYTGVQLSNATHAVGTPWRQVSDNFNGDIPPNVKIPNDIIQQHFQAKIK